MTAERCSKCGGQGGSPKHLQHFTEEQEANHQRWLGSTRQTLRALASQLDGSLRADVVARDARHLADQQDIDLIDLKDLVDEAEDLRTSIDTILGNLRGALR